MYDRTAYGFALSGVCKIEETGEIIDLQEIDFAEQQFIEGISVTELYIGGEVDSWGEQIEKNTISEVQ
ncbi:hypothetical protein ACN4EE_22330 [Geminocystis sp. CENA526]|uniref:hypothetical protein n=1 Tax=Geminocystis sp. CENA526 TaxID=1355871 RepID=UPI003D6EAF5D